MEIIYTSKIGKTGSSKTIVIPVDILNGLGWDRGDRVYFTLAQDDTLIIKKLSDETIRRLKDISRQAGFDEETIMYD